MYIKNAMIRKKWSPDAIAGKLKLDKNTALCISTESIYRFVYTSAVAAKLKLYSYLPSKRYKSKKEGTGVKGSLYHKGSQYISVMQ
ncbi:hypothetical protein [Rickettsia endosymbiont of Gonocerus acuteangulatus]|uniref:hypothetical protein n=1 Tax=Rickettsia endosymbiont of Gonocerus acuteangulatus TaxID=3066266 RepID=UPI00313340A2